MCQSLLFIALHSLHSDGGVGWDGGKGREGKGREGKGREGKGREGKGREGKGGEVYRQSRGLLAYLGDLADIAELASELGLEGGQAVRAPGLRRATVDRRMRVCAHHEGVAFVVADVVLVARILLCELEHLACPRDHLGRARVQLKETLGKGGRVVVVLDLVGTVHGGAQGEDQMFGLEVAVSEIGGEFSLAD